jgi:NagD protein
MLNGLMRRHGVQPQEMMMVGDRLYTDVAMAQHAGAIGVLVLTGEATRADAEKMFPPPDLIFPSVKELGDALETSRRK